MAEAGGRWYETGAQAAEQGGQLDRAAGAECVAEITFDTGERRKIRPEQCAHGRRFSGVVVEAASAVRFDKRHVGRPQTGIGERHLHHAAHGAAVRRGAGGVMDVAQIGAAEQQVIVVRRVVRLQQYRAHGLADLHAVALRIEGPATLRVEQHE